MKKPLLLVFIAFALLSAAALEARTHKASGEDIEALQLAQESSSKVLAGTVQTVTSLQVDLQALKGALQENRHFYEEESEKNANVLKDFDLRLTGMEERLSLFESQLQDLITHGGKGSKAVNSKEDDDYRKALAAVNVQNFRAAIPLFNQFIKKYPKSSLADNAQYWKGESLYGLRKFPEAVLEFQKVIKKYPKSEKVPAAILKQGYSLFETKSYLDAKAFLQKVVTEFPTSEEASKARERIQQIDRILAKPSPPVRPRSPAGSAPGPANP